MVQLLVGVDKGRAWLQKSKLTWLTIGDAPLQIYKDFSFIGNTLSVWEVNDEQAEADVVIAMAAGRDHLQPYFHVVFDGDSLVQIGITATPVPGKSIRPNVNSLHRDIAQLTVTNFAELAKCIYSQDVKPTSDSDIAKGIRDAVSKGEIDKSHLKPQVIEKVFGS